MISHPHLMALGALAIALPVAGGCAMNPATQTQLQPPPPPRPYSPPQREAWSDRMKRSCDEGHPRDCSALASAYETGDATYAPELGRDLSMAAVYREKGCQLGQTLDCSLIAKAYADGIGVNADLDTAAIYQRKSCDSNDLPAVSGYDCLNLGLALLKKGYIVNYEEATDKMKRGCMLQPGVCEILHYYVGSLDYSTSAFPESVVEYTFGASSKDVVAICKKQKGKYLRLDSTSGSCIAPEVKTLPSEVAGILFKYCGKQVLCAVTIHLERGSADNLGLYYKLKNILTDKYGTPSLVTTTLGKGCDQSWAVAGQCALDGRATFDSSWEWEGSNGIILSVLKKSMADVGAALAIYYGTSESSKATPRPGL